MRRLRPLIRAAIVASLVLATWAIARPAYAAAPGLAPFCDDRGASGIASPPLLEATDEAILRARTPPCSRGELSAFASIARGKSGFSPRLHKVAPLQSPATLSLAEFAPLAARRRPAVRSPPRGVHSRIERPPRGFTHARDQFRSP